MVLIVGLVIGASWAGARSCGAPEVEEAEHAHASSGAAATIWTCSMHPQIRQPEPGQCPICGMDLIPVTSEGDDRAPDRVVLSERAQALMRLRTEEVRRQADAASDLRLLGRFEANETTLKTVTAWTGGRIDRLRVNVTGERVRAGQVIATLYSPEVFAAHQDLLVAKRQVDRMQSSPEASRMAARAALEAARERLRLLGVPDDEVSRMERQERPTRAVAIRSPFGGTVIERMATEGSYVSTGTPLYRIANLSSLWLQLDAYENDLPRLAVGQGVRVTVEAIPGEVFEGEVTFIEPTLDPRRRTARVRVQVDNQERRLRPGMFAEATVATGETKGEQSPLVVPRTAPLFTGRRSIVYVEIRSEDRVGYEPRTVRLGPRLGDVYPVVAGLAEGERIVARGAFALDADLQIRGGHSMMAPEDDRSEHAWDEVIDIAPAVRRSFAPLVVAYLDVQSALADDDLDAAKTAAAKLSDNASSIRIERPRDAHAAWSEIADPLRGHGRHVAMAASLEGAREGFEPLSEAIIDLLTRFGNPLDEPLRLAFCPMASGSDGARWVQKGEAIDNAYFGAAMLTCGEVRQEVPQGGYLAVPRGRSAEPRRAAPAGGHAH
ncbi:MAG: efflux RND transporter periplasmic adaptor subunit [Deltaproteobacteria bacterium]